MKRMKKPSVTPGWGPAQCGDAARHGHTASTFPHPPQKGLPRSGLATKGRDPDGERIKEIRINKSRRKDLITRQTAHWKLKKKQQRMQRGKLSTADKGSREEGNKISGHVSVGWTHGHIDSIKGRRKTSKKGADTVYESGKKMERI